jgi:cell division protein FtsB
MKTEKFYTIEESDLKTLIVFNCYYLRINGLDFNKIKKVVTEQDLENAVLALTDSKILEEIDKITSTDELIG